MIGLSGLATFECGNIILDSDTMRIDGLFEGKFFVFTMLDVLLLSSLIRAHLGTDISK